MSGPSLRRPADVAVVETTDDDAGGAAVYLAHLPHGPLIVLRGTAAMVWQESTAGALDDLPARVAARVADVTATEIGGEVEAFIADLLARGLLERSPAGGATD